MPYAPALVTASRSPVCGPAPGRAPASRRIRRSARRRRSGGSPARAGTGTTSIQASYIVGRIRSFIAASTMAKFLFPRASGIRHGSAARRRCRRSSGPALDERLPSARCDRALAHRVDQVAGRRRHLVVVANPETTAEVDVMRSMPSRARGSTRSSTRSAASTYGPISVICEPMWQSMPVISCRFAAPRRGTAAASRRMPRRTCCSSGRWRCTDGCRRPRPG